MDLASMAVLTADSVPWRMMSTSLAPCSASRFCKSIVLGLFERRYSTVSPMQFIGDAGSAPACMRAKAVFLWPLLAARCSGIRQPQYCHPKWQSGGSTAPHK
eukprot:scaffold181739_cov14-Prasinocladus_malaysianus.AAC.1